jgi:predicted nucleic acid-binding protein
MARKAKGYVMDSWSVVAYLGGELAGQQVADLIADAHESGAPLLMCVVNAGEVWYLIARATSDAEADRAVAELSQLGIELVDVGWELARAAAGFKSRHRMSYSDCFAAALAKQGKGALVTGDPEFRQLEAEVRLLWLEEGSASSVG